MPTTLTYDALKAAVTGGAAALRLTLKLEAVSPKVFPPTYEGGKYATEDRVIDKVKVPCVLLDSVPSQANRMEAALQDAYDRGEIKLPVVSVDFTAVENPGVRKITSLQAPHRIADAILRDSTFGEGKTATKFRESSIGKELDLLHNGYATPLLKYAPHSLVFGMWDSTGKRGGLGVKFARALVSEIIGVNAVMGVKTSSRIDPLGITLDAGPVFRMKDGGWTTDDKLALQEKGKPVKFKNNADTDAKKEGKPSSINHGNIKPTLSTSAGGCTIDYAEQTTVLSLPALRRLRFPADAKTNSTPAGDLAARTYLAALGLLGAVLAVDNGYDLRSRCVLHATKAVIWQLLGRPGEADTPLSLDREAALKLYADALAAVQASKLPIELDEVALTPTPALVGLVKKSMELTAAGIAEPAEGA